MPEIDPLYLLDSYYFDLPESLIAQSPPDKRGESRLMCLGDAVHDNGHYMFDALPELLPKNSLLVANNVQVVPARLNGNLASGGKCEILILTPLPRMECLAEPGGKTSAHVEVLARPARKFKPGNRFEFGAGIEFFPESAGEFGQLDGRLVWSGDLKEALFKAGEMPLPPYIRRPQTKDDALRYQTAYACGEKAGAVAAPTAGLHFTPQLREALVRAGHNWLELTLYVGYGTFSPVRTADIRDHAMHVEWLDIPLETVNAVLSAKESGRPVVAVGTTSARALEGTAGKLEHGHAFVGGTDIFIYPGYEFKVVDRLITNFHLPHSSLLMLVSALAGYERLMGAYSEAVGLGYRFFSYGDAMLV